MLDSPGNFRVKNGPLFFENVIKKFNWVSWAPLLHHQKNKNKKHTYARTLEVDEIWIADNLPEMVKILCIDLAGLRTQILGQTLCWVFPWGCFQKKFKFK